MGFFSPLNFLGFSVFSHLHPASWCAGQRKELERTFLLIPFPACAQLRLLSAAPGPSQALFSGLFSSPREKRKLHPPLEAPPRLSPARPLAAATIGAQRHLEAVVEIAARGIPITSPGAGKDRKKCALCANVLHA